MRHERDCRKRYATRTNDGAQHKEVILRQPILLRLSWLMLIWPSVLQCSCGSRNQKGQAAAVHVDSMQVVCYNRVSDFFRWFQGFAKADTVDDHILKSGIDSVVRIDSMGCRRYIEKFYTSGFFTDEWKEKAIDTLLAADNVLAEKRLTDTGELEDVNLPALESDPALRIEGADWFWEGESEYTWRVENFKRKGGNSFSVDLVCQLKHPMTDIKSDDFRWTVEIALDGGALKINQIPKWVRESTER